MPNNQNVLRNVSEFPMDVEHGGNHYTIGPFDRLVLPDLGDTNLLVSLQSTACSGSTVGGNVYPEDELNVHGNTDRSFTAGTVQFNAQDASQRDNF